MNDVMDAHSKFTHARLVIETDADEGMVFPLRETIISIGRGPENSIQIIDAHMSRNHSMLILNDGAWYVRDLNSKNGTLLNETLTIGDQLLHSDDRIQIGDTIFVYEQDKDVRSSGENTTGMRVLKDDGTLTPSHVLKLRGAPGPEGGGVGNSLVPIHDASRLDVLYQVTDMISSILDLDELLGRVMDLIQQFLAPDRAGILLYDEHYDILLPKIIRRPPDMHEDIVISSTIVSRAVNEQAAILVNDAPHDTRFKASESIVFERIQSVICTPLIFKNEVLGVLYLDQRQSSRGYTESDLRLVGGIANQAALAIANSRLHRRLMEQHAQERELQIARTIQENLLPKTMPVMAGFEISGMSRAARMVGGDYFDVIALPDGRFILAIADVSGKGVPAAILIAAVRAAVQIEVRDLPGCDLVRVVERLNQMVCRDTSGNMFVTMVLGLLDVELRRFTYCNAGHVHPILCHGDGRVEMLDTGGCFLGIMPGMAFAQGSVELPMGSYLTFYSDGVTDMMNERHEMYGMQRLLDFLVTAGGLSAELICRKLEESANIFREGAEPFDDLTILVLKAIRS